MIAGEPASVLFTGLMVRGLAAADRRFRGDVMRNPASDGVQLTSVYARK